MNQLQLNVEYPFRFFTEKHKSASDVIRYVTECYDYIATTYDRTPTLHDFATHARDLILLGKVERFMESNREGLDNEDEGAFGELYLYEFVRGSMDTNPHWTSEEICDVYINAAAGMQSAMDPLTIMFLKDVQMVLELNSFHYLFKEVHLKSMKDLQGADWENFFGGKSADIINNPISEVW